MGRFCLIQTRMWWRGSKWLQFAYLTRRNYRNWISSFPKLGVRNIHGNIEFSQILGTKSGCAIYTGAQYTRKITVVWCIFDILSRCGFLHHLLCIFKAHMHKESCIFCLDRNLQIWSALTEMRLLESIELHVLLPHHFVKS